MRGVSLAALTPPIILVVLYILEAMEFPDVLGSCMRLTGFLLTSETNNNDDTF